MGSDESHFNVSEGNDGQSHRTVSTNYNLFEEKGEPKRYRTEVLPLTNLTPYRYAKPAYRGRTRGIGPFCFTSTEARWLMGGGGGGTKEWRLDREYRPKKTGETVDRRQNNGSVKAVSPHHCPATSALRNCCFNCRAWAVSQGQCPLHCCWATTRSERSPTFEAQLHLPTHDLFWANLKVQLHLPPLDLLIFWSRLEPWGRTHVSEYIYTPRASNTRTCVAHLRRAWCTIQSLFRGPAQDHRE